MKDQQLSQLIARETRRQTQNIELIASENYVSADVLEAVGSILTNKYAEGYPGRRYYGGCEEVDQVENLARERLCQLFGAEHANVQPHSGSQANMAVYMTVLNPGDRVLGMDLNSGGHLTHGHTLNFSGRLYEFHSYGVDRESEQIHYDEVLSIARQVRPKLIVAGASAYPRQIDFRRFREIADEVGAVLMVDMAHIAGLVAAGEHMNPVPYADFVTSTTHKTLRGPRGGVILCRQQFARDLDRNVFPGMQGGPLMHVIAGKAVCFYEALQPEFKDYARQVIRNCQAFAQALQQQGFRLISGGSDNHLILAEVKGPFGLSGRQAEALLDEIHITCNKNAIPFDPEKPMVTSGIRLGTAAMTTRGFKEEEFRQVARWMGQVLAEPDNTALKERLRQEVIELTSRYPLIRND